MADRSFRLFSDLAEIKRPKLSQ
ncbi:MAG: hypothetical protein QOE56_2209, partial [Solirubrobacterales bacterium]|nr:hypothetical protein [Solirubrobacterales bacterium]